MKLRHSALHVLALLVLCRALGVEPGVPQDLAARDDVRKIAIKFRDRGYAVTPANDGVQRGTSTIYHIDLARGSDCIVMVGIDGGMAVDLYIKDEVGNVLVQDTRPLGRACASFTAAYNGSYDLIVFPSSKANLAGNFAVLIAVKPPSKSNEPAR